MRLLLNEFTCLCSLCLHIHVLQVTVVQLGISFRFTAHSSATGLFLENFIFKVLNVSLLRLARWDKAKSKSKTNKHDSTINWMICQKCVSTAACKMGQSRKVRVRRINTTPPSTGCSSQPLSETYIQHGTEYHVTETYSMTYSMGRYFADAQGQSTKCHQKGPEGSKLNAQQGWYLQ
ncbi:hypothetical protein IRJ41_002328 [Triplophysa rosa]|uniref:Uncharacterized protein n=1 Tax=Triplophysa rosa TaxID=992332 RepID=A0A9W7T3A8_TRIRA|nr:hypothetical protein IRJ41_002328 [Triplophysa rosa]